MVEQNIKGFVMAMKERSLIQTFSADRELVGAKSEIEQIIGNAVPVKLGEFIGRTVKELDALSPLETCSDGNGREKDSTATAVCLRADDRKDSRNIRKL